MSEFRKQLINGIAESLHGTLEVYWQDWRSACEQHGVSAEPDIDPALLGRQWACSDFIARTCIRRPDLLHHLVDEGFESPRSADAFRARVRTAIEGSEPGEAGLMKALRLQRQQEMLRIAWRDLAQLADIDSILVELTDLAEAFVDETHQHLYRILCESMGVPRNANGDAQHMLVMAMGKFGGRELNFSSDIDLIFSFPEEGETDGRRRRSNHEFFVRLAGQLVRTLDEITAEGFVYRVDTRLRPYGDSGPPVMNFNGMEHYYQLQGRDWERYAMIKARFISGRAQDIETLESTLRPFVYRRYLDFGAFESIREMKGMIEADIRRRRLGDNIKLGEGGIREIEFIGQTLQLIRGGREPVLQSRSIIEVLDTLARLELMSAADRDALTSAYRYLRRVENRLQILRDQQTHKLPADDLDRARICLAMGYAGGSDDWETLIQQLNRHRAAVNEIFSKLISYRHEETSEIEKLTTLFWSDPEHALGLVHWLEQNGCRRSQEITELLQRFRGSARIRSLPEDSARRLQQLMASLLEQIAHYEHPVTLLDRTLMILTAIVWRTVYISLLVEYPLVQKHMLDLCSRSQWFADELSRHPLLLDDLLGAGTDTSRATEQGIREELDNLMSMIAEDDLEQQMDRLRQFRRAAAFRMAAEDALGGATLWTVGAQLSVTAEVILERVLALAWNAVVKRHGIPECIIDGEKRRPGIAIIAYGKLGGHELGYASDLDVVFLHNSAGEKQYTGGDRQVDNTQFFNRVAQKVLHILGTRTHSGILYETDTRLRPDGRAGLMVGSVAAFEDYQRDKAWTWEHQALLRARSVAGDALVAQEFDRIRHSVIAVERDWDRLRGDVIEMREKMRKHLASGDDASFDVKQDAGGMVDIEFLVQAGVLYKAVERPSMLQFTSTLEFIDELREVGWFTGEEASMLAACYRDLRRLGNQKALQIEASHLDEQELQAHRDHVVALWQRLMKA